MPHFMIVLILYINLLNLFFFVFFFFFLDKKMSVFDKYGAFKAKSLLAEAANSPNEKGEKYSLVRIILLECVLILLSMLGSDNQLPTKFNEKIK